VTDQLERLKTALADRYAIDREIGSGGMATVYLARDLRHERQVAVKVLRPDLAVTLGPERFHREIKIAARLQHPHILPLLDSGEADDFLYYVMPYVEGQSLRERLAREGALPVGDAVRILRDVVDALTEAHAHGVVHRDIKPENILLRGNHALVTDFGVAKAVSEATGRAQLTTAGVALGTPAYMAPEQASAEPHIDQRVDIYAVGAVAYELLAGRPVFMGTTAQMVLAAHMAEVPQPVTMHRETVPAALEAVVMRCLEKRPADRWQSPGELLPQLEALVTPSGGLTPTDTRPIAAAPLRAPINRNLRVAAAAVTTVALLTIGAWIVARSGGHDVDPRSLVVLPFTTAGTDEESEAFAIGVHEDVVTQLSKVRALRVLARTSGEEYRNTTKPTRQIGEELGVANLIQGSVRRAGDQVRVNVTLIEAATGQSLWGETYTREWTVEDLFAIQSAIAREVAGALAASLSPEEVQQIEVRPTDSREAYDAYLRARFHADRSRNRDDLERAVQFYEQAIAADPRFAAAFAGLAYARIFLFWEFTRFDQADSARAALDRAVLLAPETFETHLAQGNFHYYFNRAYDQALEHFFAAERLRPGDPEVLAAIGYVRRRQGRWEEAVAALKQSLERDPRSANTALALGETYRWMRRQGDAKTYLDRALDLDPSSAAVQGEKFALLRSVLGDSAGARRFLEEYGDRMNPAVLQFRYAQLAYYGGDVARALRVWHEGTRSYSDIGTAAFVRGDRNLQLAYGDSLVLRGDRRLSEIPQAYRAMPYRTVLGPHIDRSLGNALLGNAEESLGEARAALELLPISTDAIRGLDAVHNLAEVCAILGRAEEAIEQLERLLAIPSFWTAADFQMDPLFASFRDHPRFQAMLETYEN
jgi:serine/threonine-protein kinase